MKKYLLTSSLLVLLLSSCGSSKFDAEYYKGKLTIDTSSLVSSSGSNKINNASGEQEVSFNSTYYTNGFYYKVTSGDAVSEVTTLLVDGKVLTYDHISSKTSESEATEGMKLEPSFTELLDDLAIYIDLCFTQEGVLTAEENTLEGSFEKKESTSETYVNSLKLSFEANNIKKVNYSVSKGDITIVANSEYTYGTKVAGNISQA